MLVLSIFRVIRDGQHCIQPKRTYLNMNATANMHARVLNKEVEDTKAIYAPLDFLIQPKPYHLVFNQMFHQTTFRLITDNLPHFKSWP